MQQRRVYVFRGRIVRLCSRCRRVLPVRQFHRNRSKPDGITDRCKECRHTERSMTRRDRHGMYLYGSRSTLLGALEDAVRGRD